MQFSFAATSFGYSIKTLGFMVAVIAVLALPIVNLVFLCLPCKNPKARRASIIVELLTMALYFGTFIIGRGYRHASYANWAIPDDYIGTYTPHLFARPPFWIFITLAMLACLLLRFVSRKDLPRTLAVVCIAAICAGALECLLQVVEFWLADVRFSAIDALVYHLPPVSCLLIFAKAFKGFAQKHTAAT